MDTWRLIEHGPGAADWNMAVDEAIFRSFCSGDTRPVVRFYDWETPSISLGRFQKPEGSIDTAFCSERGIAIVRRPTGGRAVLHGTDLTFTIVKENDGRRVEESYRELTEAVLAALYSTGVAAAAFSDSSDRQSMRSAANCFDLKARFEVAIDGRKALGSAQFRTERAILQQNSLVLEEPSADNLNAFADRRVGSEELFREQAPRNTDGFAGNAGNAAARFREQDSRNTGCGRRVDREAILRALCAVIRQSFGVRLKRSALSPEEERTAEELAVSKYRRHTWTFNGRLDANEVVSLRDRGQDCPRREPPRNR